MSTAARAAAPSPTLSSDQEQALWHELNSTGDAHAREQLMSHYLPYARVVAASYYTRRTHDEIEFAEYLQLAAVGLIEAVSRFDPAFGVQFKTFAARRMHGSILSGLERLTEKNQQIAIRRQLRQERVQALKVEAKATQNISDTAAAGARAGSRDALFRYLAEVGVGLALGVLLEGTGMVDTESLPAAGSGTPVDVSYFREAEIRQLQRVIRDLVTKLSAQEQTVIRAHYLQEIPFDEIAVTMNVSRSRVSQLHRRSLLHLREALSQVPRCDVAW